MVGNVAVVLAVVLLRTSDNNDDGPKTAQRIPRAGRVVVDRGLGVRIRKPRGWEEAREGRGITLRSPDATTIMSISQPAGGVSNRDVLRSAMGVIEQGYRRVSVRTLRAKLAGLPSVNRVVSATNRKGVRVNILVAAPPGSRRAWLVQVFSGPGARAKRLPEAQVALNTLRLRG